MSRTRFLDARWMENRIRVILYIRLLHAARIGGTGQGNVEDVAAVQSGMDDAGGGKSAREGSEPSMEGVNGKNRCVKNQCVKTRPSSTIMTESVPRRSAKSVQVRVIDGQSYLLYPFCSDMYMHQGKTVVEVRREEDAEATRTTVSGFNATSTEVVRHVDDEGAAGHGGRGFVPRHLRGQRIGRDEGPGARPQGGSLRQLREVGRGLPDQAGVHRQVLVGRTWPHRRIRVRR